MRHLLLHLLCFATSLSLVYCQTPGLEGLREVENLAYLPEEELEDSALQRLNLVLPADSPGFPLLIWIGGGAWSYGDRHHEMNFARQMAGSGVAVACVGHRLSPAIWRDSSLKTGIQHPEHIRVVAAAVKWLHDHAPEYGYDANRMIIGGYSSGAHLAALLVLDTTYMKERGLGRSSLKGVIPVSGTYDLVNYHQVLANGGRPELAQLHVEAVFGSDMEVMVAASPVNHLASLHTPMLLMSDNNMYAYARLLEDRIRETSFRDVQVVYAYSLSHGELWRALSNDPSCVYREVMRQFIEDNTAQ